VNIFRESRGDDVQIYKSNESVTFGQILSLKNWYNENLTHLGRSINAAIEYSETQPIIVLIVGSSSNLGKH
jgi:hypothetical protein